MSSIIKKLYGAHITAPNLPMETFYSVQEADAIQEEGSAIIDMAKDKAQGVVADAQRQAAEILEQARREAEQLCYNSRTQGYTEGMQTARAEVDAEMIAIVASINKIKDMLDKNLGDVFHSIETQLLDMVLEIAKKIVGYEVAVNKNIVLEVISKCLAKTKERNSILIKVNKSDFDLVEEKKDVFLKKIRGLKGIEIEESEMVFEGGCIIETSIGDINGDIDEQFHKIRDALMTE